MLTLRSALGWVLTVALPSATIAAAQKTCAQPRRVRDATFAPGQVWSYKTRPGEEHSTVTILSVETTPKLGTVVHVRVDGIQFSNCAGGPAPDLIEHLPMTRMALEASVTTMVGSVEKIPNYDAGYEDWLRHCGGTYTIALSKVIAVDDATFNAGLGCRWNSAK